MNPGPGRPTGRSRRKRLAGLSSGIGVVLAIAGFGFVFRQLSASWADSKDLLAGATWAWLILALVFASAGMSSIGLVWRRIVMSLGGTVTRRQIFVWYQIGQLGKYLPGGLWPVVGRSEMAVKGGLRRPVAYNSVALSMGATYLCASIVCALIVPILALTSDEIGGGLWVFLFIPLGLAVLHPAVLGRLFAVAERVLGKGEPQRVPPWTTSVLLVARHTLSWLGIGVATWFVALTFDPNAPFLPVVFAGILSWVIGFLIIFVPGGLGVREAAFAAAAGSALSPELAATVAIVSRLVFILADLIGAAAALPIWRRTRAQLGSQLSPEPEPV